MLEPAVTELARLNSAVAALAVLGGSGLRVAADQAALWCLVEGGPAQHLVELGNDRASIGGWGDRALVVFVEGDAFEVEVSARRFSLREQPAYPIWAPAAGALVSARVIAGAGHPRSDRVEVWDERWNVRLATLHPESRDCFVIDALVVSPDGKTVAWTGLDTIYTSEGDWASGQHERLQIADLAGNLLHDVQIGETWRPSEHRRRPVALGHGAALVSGSVMPLDGTHWEPEDNPPLGNPAHVAALASGWAAAERTQVELATPAGVVTARVDLGAEVTALVGDGEAALVGLADGRVVRVQNT